MKGQECNNGLCADVIEFQPNPIEFESVPIEFESVPMVPIPTLEPAISSGR